MPSSSLTFQEDHRLVNSNHQSTIEDGILWNALYPSNSHEGSSQPASPARSSISTYTASSSDAGSSGVDGKHTPTDTNASNMTGKEKRHKQYHHDELSHPVMPRRPESRRKRHKHRRKPRRIQKEPTLCDLLWKRQWDAVQNRLTLMKGSNDNNNKYSDELKRSTKLPCFSNGGKGLPLHLACAMRPVPPASIVEGLLRHFPEATEQKASMWGLLPLHLAVDLRGASTTAESSSPTSESKTRNSSLHNLKAKRHDKQNKVTAIANRREGSRHLYNKHSMVGFVESGAPTFTSTSVNSTSSDNSSAASSASSVEESYSTLKGDITSATAWDVEDLSMGSDNESDKEQNEADQNDVDNSILDVNDHCKIVHLLLNANPGALHLPEEFHDMLPLHIAASSTPAMDGKVPAYAAFIMLRLLEAAPDTLQSRDGEGDTPLMLAQRANQQKVSISTSTSTTAVLAVASIGSSHNSKTVTTKKHGNGPMVWPMPDWKWNPILYPPRQLQQQNLRNRIASLLVGTMDELINMSSSSSDGGSSSYYSADLDCHSNQCSGTSTPVNNDDDSSDKNLNDDDSMNNEWGQLRMLEQDLKEQLGMFDTDLRRELEHSIRTHCPTRQLEDSKLILSVDGSDPTMQAVRAEIESITQDDNSDDEEDNDADEDNVGYGEGDEMNSEKDEDLGPEMDISIESKGFEAKPPSSLAVKDPQSKDTGDLFLEPSLSLEEAVAVADRAVEEAVDVIYCIANTGSGSSGINSTIDDYDDDLGEEMEHLSSVEESLRRELESASCDASLMKFSSGSEGLSSDEEDENNCRTADSPFRVVTRVEPSTFMDDTDKETMSNFEESRRSDVFSSGLRSTLTDTTLHLVDEAGTWDEVLLEEVPLDENPLDESDRIDITASETVEELVAELPKKKQRVFVGKRELPSFLWGLPSIQESFSLDTEAAAPAPWSCLPDVSTNKVVNFVDEKTETDDPSVELASIASDSSTKESSQVPLIRWERETHVGPNPAATICMGEICEGPENASTEETMNEEALSIEKELLRTCWGRIARRAKETTTETRLEDAVFGTEPVTPLIDWKRVGRVPAVKAECQNSTRLELGAAKSDSRETSFTMVENDMQISLVCDSASTSERKVVHTPEEGCIIFWERIHVSSSDSNLKGTEKNSPNNRQCTGSVDSLAMTRVQTIVEEPSLPNSDPDIDSSRREDKENDLKTKSELTSQTEVIRDVINQTRNIKDSSPSTGGGDWDSETSNHSNKTWLEGVGFASEKQFTSIASEITRNSLVEASKNATESAAAEYPCDVPYVVFDNSEAYSEITDAEQQDKPKPYLARPPTSALTELTQQLQLLKKENELKSQETERLKQRVSIMTEIKGVSANELRYALQAICEKEEDTLESSSRRESHRSTTISGNDSGRSGEKCSPIGEVLDHWLQELNAEEKRQQDQEMSRKDETQELSHCSTPSLSPPRIIKTNDGIENWPIDNTDTPTCIIESGRLAVRSLTKSSLGLDHVENLSDWCDELLEETANEGRKTTKGFAESQTAPPASVVRDETDHANVKAKTGSKVPRAPEVMKQSVPSSQEDDSCDSVVGLEIKADAQRDVESSDKDANCRHRARLRDIMERRKQAGGLLTSDRVLESLLKSRQFSGRPGSRDPSEFDCSWDKVSSCYTDNRIKEGTLPQMWRHIPPPPPPPPPPPTQPVRKPSGLKSVTKPFEHFILSSPIDDVIGDLMEKECEYGKIEQIVKPRKPCSSRSVKISVHENDDIRSESRKEDRAPSKTAGCLGIPVCPEELMTCGESLKDTTRACVDKVREAQEAASSKILGSRESTKTVSEDDSGFAPGLIGFVDQLAADLDKTISGLSDFIQSMSTCGVAAIEQTVDTPLCGMPPADEEEDSLFDGKRSKRSISSKTARRNRRGKKARGNKKKTCCGLYARRSVYI